MTLHQEFAITSGRYTPLATICRAQNQLGKMPRKESDAICFGHLAQAYPDLSEILATLAELVRVTGGWITDEDAVECAENLSKVVEGFLAEAESRAWEASRRPAYDPEEYDR